MINVDGETCDPPGSVQDAFGNVCRDSCTYCGDGIVNNGEECDYADPNAPEGCRNDCTISVCGDDVVDTDLGETCDPPGSMPDQFGNVCRDSCTYCGDGLVNNGEVCDYADPNAPANCQNDCTICEGQIGDCVWHDGVVGMECDGIQEPDCANGINGLEVRLYDDAGALVRTTTTGMGPAGDGYYQFMDLCAGTYTVEIDTPDGLVTAPAMVGDPALDSNGSPAMVTLAADDSTDQKIDFGFCEEREGGEGCTPGYWKQEQHFGSWFGYMPGMLVGGVFNEANAHFPDLADDTLLDALDYGGGSGAEGAARNLLRAAVASVLNASTPDVAFDWSEADVISAVNAALATEDRHTMLDLAGDLDDDNNDGCPLGRAEMDPRESRPDVK
jgi:cysteine-rich repeat protein